MKKPVLYIVIPCYNEEVVLPISKDLFLNKLLDLIKLEKISDESRIMFVNDGSKDKTWEIISSLSKENEHFIGISQNKNRGHQSSLLAGLMEARKFCDITISIDCDGQDDVNAMDKMVDDYLSGSEIVYGVRDNRKSDSFFKRTSAQSFYKLLNRFGGNIIYNHADYRLMSSRALNEFNEFKEVNLFLRGLVPLIGFKSSQVYYKRSKRIAGESHYPLKKMIGLALDGITSLSVKPLRISMYFGLFVAFLSFVGIIWSIVLKINDASISGWASTITIILFLGGVQLISIGVLGEYIGKIYMESKHRPRYIISERTEKVTEDDEIN